MREIYEVRVPEEYAGLLFDSDEGERLGDLVRKVLMPANDQRLQRIGGAR